MRILVTGSAGHLGEALATKLKQHGHVVVGLDILPSGATTVVGSITDRNTVRECMQDVDAVVHTATLHKPHVATHSRQAFIDVNITGTNNLLEEASIARVGAFVFTSTTSLFGDALSPSPDQPAAWITEQVNPIPKNIYGVTKCAAEDLCQLFHRNQKLPVVVLRTSRFFPEPDDNAARREAFDDLNLKVNELLYRRVDVHDVVSAHVAAIARAADIGFDKFIISATSPFQQEDLAMLRGHAPDVVSKYVPQYAAAFRKRGWFMLKDIDRVYVNRRAIDVLGWKPEYDFANAIKSIELGKDPLSPVARSTGIKGYHAEEYRDGLYPV